MRNIFKKEMLDCFRDRRTLMLSVFVPIVLMSALVFFYENLLSDEDEEAHKVAVNEGQLRLAEQLFAAQNIVLTEAENVEEMVAKGEVDAGIVLPSKFEEAIRGNAVPQVQIFSDIYSQNGSLVTMLIETALNEYRQQIIAQRLVDEQVEETLLAPFLVEQVQAVEGDHGMMMIAYLIPLMLCVAIGIGAAPAAADLFAGEKERRTMEALLMTPVNRHKLLFGKWLAIVCMATITGVVTLLVVGIEVYFFTETLKSSLIIGNQVAFMAIVIIAAVIAYSCLIGSILVLTSVIAKTVKEAQSYSAPIMILTILPALYVSGLGLAELSTIHFVVPVVNLFAIFKEVLLGVMNMKHVLMMIGSNVLTACILILIGRILFMKDRWVMGN